MARKLIFRQGDVTRVAKGLRAAGLGVTRVEMEPDGKIVLLTGSDEPTEAVAPFDIWKRQKDARPA
ncbi:hypothetical protein [Breoghania sp. L-A4]|uniref:hypothetical protein n=1 Tax=Breoghania sp. L-A4 TaxID=2304600 RepID=UPI000E3582B8|nr:hypothetical protein [Breoghania sp. L-A4]AXS39231.1 hypothetical protein D1F64_03170 [Breoghania sp. L-A4]